MTTKPSAILRDFTPADGEGEDLRDPKVPSSLLKKRREKSWREGQPPRALLLQRLTDFGE